MAEEIRQELGFDAKKALDTLNSLNSLMGNFESTMGRVVDRLEAFNRVGKVTADLLKGIAREGGKAATAMDKLSGAKTTKAKPTDMPLAGVGESAEQAAEKVDKATDRIKRSSKNLDEAGKSTRRLTVDFQTMVRIVTTQAIVRALSTLRNLLRGAVSDAIEYQTSIAEIGTIAPTDDLADLSARVREVSDAFNVPLEAATKGYYQTISNQIGSTTDEFDTFLKAAAKFSKTAVTDIKSAVDLGSGSLNAFGKSANDAEEVFAKFFVTIKQGRVTGSELAQTYGTVAPLASKLGVEIEELNAALATITINGVAADKATTQLRGVFNSFLKPTKEMSEALRKLGYDSGQQILQAYDLQEALRLVASQTDGSAEAIAKLIPRVRGLTGGITLIDDKTEHFNETMEAQRQKLAEIYERGYKLVVETDAQRITKELNKLKNFMTTEFGESVLEAGVEMSQLVGGADTLMRVMESIGKYLPTLVVGITAVGSAFAFMALKAKLAATGLKTVGGAMGALALIPAAQALGDFLGQSYVDSWNADHKAYLDMMERQEQARKEKVSAELAIERQKVKELEQLLAREFAEVRKHYYAIADAAVDSNKDMLKDAKFFTNGMIQEAQKIARAYQGAFDKMGDNVRKSEERTADLQTTLDDRTFDRRIKKWDEIHQVYALTQRSIKVGAKAADELSKATTEDARASAAEEFKRADAFAKQALKIAEGTGNRVLEAKVLKTMDRLTRDNIRSEEDYQRTIANSQIQMLRRAKVEERRVADMKVKQEELLKAFTLYDEETGELLSFEARTEKLKEGQKALNEFIALSTKDKPLDVAQMMNFAGLSATMNREISGFRVEELRATSKALQNLSQQVQDSLNKYRLEVPAFKLLEEQTGIQPTGPKSEQAAIAQLLDEYDALIVKKQEIIDTDAQVVRRTLEFEDALQKAGDAQDSFSINAARGWAALKDLVGVASAEGDIAFFNQFKDALPQTEDLEGLKKSLRELQALETGQGFTNRVLTADFKTSLADMILALGKLIEAEEKAKEVRKTGPEDQQNLKAINARLNEIDAVKKVLEQPSQDAQAMATATTATQVAMTNSVQPASLLEQSWANIAASAQIAATASANVKSPAMAAHGGVARYLASGGAARGTDRIAAMLSKGEFVVNAKSSRQFYSQLSAMNAGMKPVFRESGGTVTNIGDTMTVNVTEATNAQATAREVMNRIRREKRRGSGRL
jgi:TP901 family phage tail tape measure protein